ncbi:hypothetical protein [Paenarthrobacter nicotinovorans]|uniref:hypothetical protein n=1 Tax=Paenarthrobacter nicotinovorans TaxID=29320 RepID=UPI0012DF12F1|nr:hypothetical protein [Paenarthrobacter nicotinovorans]
MQNPRENTDTPAKVMGTKTAQNGNFKAARMKDRMKNAGKQSISALAGWGHSA